MVLHAISAALLRCPCPAVNHWGYFIYLNWMPTYFYRVLGALQGCANVHMCCWARRLVDNYNLPIPTAWEELLLIV